MALNYEELDLVYTNRCSDVTLFSDDNGFFKSLCDELLLIAKNDNWLQNFGTVEESCKIENFISNKEVMEALTEVLSRIQPLHRGKDAKISKERRLAAQKALENGENTKALELACQAVLKAPMVGADEVIDGGVSLALALWVRSEILLQLNRPKAALEDLKLALKEHLPAKMRAQYYWRMGHCYKGAEEPSRAKVSYELAVRLIGKDEVAKAQLLKDIDSLIYKEKNENILPIMNTADSLNTTLSGGARLNLPSLSKLIKITEEKEKGRFAVANGDVNTGDVLLIDNPYAACLLTDNYGTHCLHCFTRLATCNEMAPVWCPKCSGVAFCSVQCKEIALSTYHIHECPFADIFIGSGMSILSHIALRMITQTDLDTNLSIYSKYCTNNIKTVDGTILNDVEGTTKKSRLKSRKEKQNRSKKFSKDFENKITNDNEKKNKTSGDDNLEIKAAQIYSLCTHSEKRRGEDHFKRIIMAMFLTACLKNGIYFKGCQNTLQAEKSILELIYRNLQLLQFNAHEIYETLRGQHRLKGSKPVYIAVGIYPTGALFNHECVPAVARYFEGRKIILRATRPLSIGDVVSENYGPNFMMHPLKERQRSLACRYWFKCECIACEENWPTLNQMSKKDPLFLRCSKVSCKGKIPAYVKSSHKCTKCSLDINEELCQLMSESINKCVLKYEEGKRLMNEERVEDAITTFCEAIDSFYKAGCTPHRETHVAQETLRSCFAATGNNYVAPENKKN